MERERTFIKKIGNCNIHVHVYAASDVLLELIILNYPIFWSRKLKLK